MKLETQIKLKNMFQDPNMVSKKHIREDHESYKIRMAKKYAKENNLKCAINETYTTGVRTWKDFGIYDYKITNEVSHEITHEVKNEEEEKRKEFRKEIYMDLKYTQLINELRKKEGRIK